MKYRIAIAPGTEENPDYGVIVPDLPGCYSQGDDLDDAVTKAKASVELWIEGMLEEGLPVQQPSDPSELAARPEFAGVTWASVDVDLAKIEAKLER
ncbi:type II toxin-antitoxin system HicB family antitoxin [Sutterella megalosphaeroides]|uniref:HicB-like antitoxin of toxin-antitoxin system domain-containing protein n=1 Tax=Sutterella megalosphaeroides TaxID=2494234 RepID=A0A2Z6IE10_9BURK|nr:type II toxin-antitoxin system HicB family antitoxin [Sutterella megalosphaeroides]BBF23867.1 hypothetical protein SUTMEG_17580 [Sutterella megalosphaeroides]